MVGKGDLSPEDCETHLARRLVQDDQPLIGADIRAAITARSHGLPLHLDLAVSRFLEIRRTGRTPTPADFDCTFPALLARTLSDLTPDERHLLRSISLLDAFDLDLATRTAGLAQQAPARRLIERPLVNENPYALWPYHLHRAIRSAVRDDDHSDDRWTPADWHQAANRALTALGDQWTNATALGPSRMLLVACLRQGLRLAREHRLSDLGWLTAAAHAYTDDSVWEPLSLPTDTTADPAPDTPPTPWPSSSRRSPTASTNTASAPPTGSPPSSTAACCPPSSPRWACTTGPRHTRTSARTRPPAQECSGSPTRAAGTLPGPSAVWPTWHACPGTSPPR
ncbi:hypothetical protein [Streptomyces cirratus]|uniref:hypothetical protein n=1 Tax=Streptomyces cirratus TaxID=68187 RepID=UPI00360CAB2C